MKSWCLEVLSFVAVAGILSQGCSSTPEKPPELECDCSVPSNRATLPDLQGRSATLGPHISIQQRAGVLDAVPQLVESSRLVRASEARAQFNVTGQGQTAVILDTGIRKTHADFAGRILFTWNFTSEGDPEDATDQHGHGTHVAGVVAANGPHTGLAPGANLIALKVLDDTGNGDFDWVASALEWVLDNIDQYRISVVSLSLGLNSNLTSDDSSTWPEVSRTIQTQIRALAERRVAVVIAAGNSYYSFDSKQGMSFPAIIREAISVGAVYDSNVGQQAYGSGAIARTTGPGHITPFTQRLHPCVNPQTATDIFAPGAPMTATGIFDDRSGATMSGTSQATPTVTGVILLAQELYKRRTGTLPPVGQLTAWLNGGGVRILDGDDENSNVTPTGCDFYRLDAVNVLTRASQ